MHDWVFVALTLEWFEGNATFSFRNHDSMEVYLVAEGLVELKVPKREEWGESVCVNEVYGPKALENGNSYIAIEIQSGDKIEVEARSITLPECAVPTALSANKD